MRSRHRCGNVFHSAAAEGAIADLAARDTDVLRVVNGRQQAAFTAGRQLVGPPVGSLTFSAAQWIPFGVNAGSFLGSAVLLLLLPRSSAGRPRPHGMWRELGRSTTYVLAHHDLRVMAILTGTGNFGINMVMGILVLYGTDANGLDITEAGYGLLLVAMAAGGVLGGFIAPWTTRQLGSRGAVIAALAIQGAAWLTVGWTNRPIIAGVALAAAFAGVTVISVVVAITRQQHVPPERLGQVISAFRLVGNGPAPLGALAGGALAGLAGLPAPIMAAAALSLGAALVVALLPKRSMVAESD